jgi:ribosome-associated translation inhibitor RaiA
MRLRVSSSEKKLEQSEVDRIQHDLEKIDRRLNGFRGEINAEVRINASDNGANMHHAVLEVRYGRNHLIANVDHADVGQAVRTARDEILRQINDRSRGSHSQYAKGR